MPARGTVWASSVRRGKISRSVPEQILALGTVGQGQDARRSRQKYRAVLCSVRPPRFGTQVLHMIASCMLVG